ncbi:hypothetical protein F2Q69_00061329 [Brassica cretica]|uniref:Uncharacterized protein n=1 Tax=Brassica cretica TaxID=69181 RepID=A0A8S9RBB1_BRACR|nr:hypothetical protein F2Q69_00061329 [Brassica cretica]
MPQTHHRGGTSPYYLHNGLREPQMSRCHERWRNTRSRATWPGQQNTIIGSKRPDPQWRSPKTKPHAANRRVSPEIAEEEN